MFQKIKNSAYYFCNQRRTWNPRPIISSAGKYSDFNFARGSESPFETRFIAGRQSTSGDGERKFTESLSLMASLAALRAGYEREARVIKEKHPAKPEDKKEREK